jgi:hypothetical protein
MVTMPIAHASVPQMSILLHNQNCLYRLTKNEAGSQRFDIGLVDQNYCPAISLDFFLDAPVV